MTSVSPSNSECQELLFAVGKLSAAFAAAAAETVEVVYMPGTGTVNRIALEAQNYW